MTTFAEKIAALLAANATIQANLVPVIGSLTDANMPLDERWSAYTKLVENNILVNEDGCGSGFIDLLGPNLTMYDDFHTDRYASITFPDMFDVIVEGMADDPEDFGGAGFSPDNVPKWQEHVLASGLSGFTYDW